MRPGYQEGRRDKAGLGYGSLESTLEGLLFFPSQRPGRQQLGLLLVGRLLGSELGPRWVLVCVYVSDAV